MRELLHKVTLIYFRQLSFTLTSVVICRKVTILVVGLDKAGKTSSIRGMLRGKIQHIPMSLMF